MSPATRSFKGNEVKFQLKMVSCLNQSLSVSGFLSMIKGGLIWSSRSSRFRTKSFNSWSKWARGVTNWNHSFGLSESGFHFRLPRIKPLLDALNVSVSNY